MHQQRQNKIIIFAIEKLPKMAAFFVLTNNQQPTTNNSYIYHLNPHPVKS